MIFFHNLCMIGRNQLQSQIKIHLTACLFEGCLRELPRRSFNRQGLFLKSPHPVGRFNRYRLADIPHFNNSACFETKDVDDCDSRLLRFHYDVRVNCHQVTIAKYVFHHQPFIWELLVVLNHASFQGRELCRVIHVMMFPMHINIVCVCFFDISSHHKLQEIYCDFFLSLDTILICHLFTL